jgi:hypothetical protein
MLRFLALAGGAYALYRRFQGSRNTSNQKYRPQAGPVADQTAGLGGARSERTTSADQKPRPTA